MDEIKLTLTWKGYPLELRYQPSGYNVAENKEAFYYALRKALYHLAHADLDTGSRIADLEMRLHRAYELATKQLHHKYGYNPEFHELLETLMPPAARTTD